MKEKYNFDYKVLHPFKWYIIENFPFLEDSIDAIDNYQLFCKLGKEINIDRDAINKLGVQVEGITDWFDDLDVQEEVNKKLDEMAESGELEEIITAYLNTNALICFNTVNNMKTAENLVDGSYARTLGFYEIDDKGGATYKIRNITNDDVIDNMFIIALNDEQNELIAELITTDNMNIKQFGIYENDSDDDSDKLNALLVKAKLLSIKLVGNNAFCKITKTINIPVYSYLDNIKLDFYSGSYTNNYAMYVNSNNTHNSWEQSYPYEFGKISNCEFKNNTNTDLNCVFNYSNSEFNTIVFNGFDTALKTSPLYLDSYKLINLNAWNNRGTNYVFDLGYLGDNVTINGLHAGGKVNIINVGNGHNGIVLNNIIANGCVNIQESNVTLNNLHQEGGNARININTKSIVKISNSFMYHNTNADQHNIDISTHCHVIVDNCQIVHFLDTTETDNSTDDIDINVGINSDLTLTNCFKKVHTADVGSKDLANIKTNLGITLNNIQYFNGSGFDNLPNIIGTNQKNSTNTIYYDATTNIAKWNIETGTYYYAIVRLADIGRKIKYSASTYKKSVSLTNGGSGYLFTGLRGIYRIYRGTSPNTYTHYVDVPHYNNNHKCCCNFKYSTNTGYMVQRRYCLQFFNKYNRYNWLDLCSWWYSRNLESFIKKRDYIPLLFLSIIQLYLIHYNYRLNCDHAKL